MSMAEEKPDPSLDLDIQALLDKARPEHAQHGAAYQHQLDAEARWRRAYDAWMRVAQFRGEAIPRGLTGDAHPAKSVTARWCKRQRCILMLAMLIAILASYVS
jgi:hypothetical protein